jgi:hypothetical protein
VELAAVVEKLSANMDQLRSNGVEALYLFGSTAHDEAGPESDVDLFFDYNDPAFSVVELVRIKNMIEEALGSPADVMTRDSIHPRLRSRVEASSLRIF